MDCQEVASGPVSASPSPMTQATIRPGLSNAAPNAWLSEYPSSPPSWIDPGVVGRDVAGDPAGERELLEQLLQPGLVLADVRVDLAVGAFQVGVADQRRAAVPGPGDIEHVQVVFLDHPVQVHVDEVLARGRAPVPDHQRLHVRQRQRPFQQRIVVQVELADRQVVRRPPVRVHPAGQFRGERARHYRIQRRHESVLYRGRACRQVRVVDVHDARSGSDRHSARSARRRSRPCR